MLAVYYIFAFLAGSMIGSFLNVVIYRMPRQLSVVTPRSNCPSCRKLIPWYYNIPIFSYLLLRGKCAYCKTKINIRYPFVELVTGLVALLLFPSNLDHANLYIYVSKFFIFSILLAHFFIDLDHQLLLDKLNLYLLLIVLPYAAYKYDVFFWLTGGIIGFGGPYLVTWIFFKLKGQIGLGGGDIKLYGILGILFGAKGVMINIFLSSLLGAVIGVALIACKLMKRDQYLPFGPFIIAVSFAQLFFPDWIQKLSALMF